MVTIHRGRVFVRGGWVAGDDVLHAMTGVVEIDAGTDDHVMTGYANATMTDGITLSATGWRRTPEAHETAGMSLGGLATSLEWPRPPRDIGAGGGLLLRATRAPAKPGRIIALLVGVFTGPGSTTAFADQTTADLAGETDGIIVMSSIDDASDWNTNGKTLDQIMQQPRWGWMEEPYGFFSTLDLATINECMSILTDEQAGADADDILRRKRECGAGVLHSNARDDRYQRFRRELLSEMGLQRWDRVETQAQIDQRDAIATRIMRTMMQTS